MSSKRILLSEGSSLSSRQTITALGQAGYRIDLCDPNYFCVGHSSRFIRRFHRCPVLGEDPLGYLRFILDRLSAERYDVLLPVHEQAFLFARVRDDLSSRVGLALPAFSSFVQVQSKVQFIRLLTDLAIPHPVTRIVTSEAELRVCRFPYFLKTEYGTASTGVWAIRSADDLEQAVRTLKARAMFEGSGLLVQERVAGKLERIQTVFDHGRLVAWHSYRQLAEGPGGGDTAKLGVVRTSARDHLELLGSRLDWHGALSADYFFDEASDQLWFIDGNPRLVEPMNGVFSGINLAEVMVRVSCGERIEPLKPGKRGVRTHMTIMALIDSAARDGSRFRLLQRMIQAVRKRGEFALSREELTPFAIDPPTLLPALFVLARLLINPKRATAIAGQAVRSYSLSDEAVRVILALEPSVHASSSPSERSDHGKPVQANASLSSPYIVAVPADN